MLETLDKIKVTPAFTPVCDSDICDVARISFSRTAAEFTEEQNAKLIKYLAREGHWSPFGHLYFDFSFVGSTDSLLEVLTETQPAGIIVTRLDEEKAAITLSVWKAKEILEYCESRVHLHDIAADLLNRVRKIKESIPVTYETLFSKYSNFEDEGWYQERLFAYQGFHLSKHYIISFNCKAPIFVARQLGKHQIGLCWNEESRRYITSDPTFLEHEALRTKPDGSIKQGSGGILENSEETLAYLNEEVVENNFQLYSELLQMGVAPEQARSELSQRMMTSFRWTGSVSAFMRVLRQRLYKNAQKETRDFAVQLGEAFLEVCPSYFAEVDEVRTLLRNV